MSLTGLSLKAAPEQPKIRPKRKRPPDGYFAGTVWRPSLRSRNGVTFLVCRAWSASSKKADLAAFKDFKLDLPEDGISDIVSDMRSVLELVHGDVAKAFATIVPVACGHSRRPDCLSFSIAAKLAEATGAKLVSAFKPRFLSGSSHPAEFRFLPPLEIAEMPDGPALVVDDVATSGFHMHEACTALRSRGVSAAGIVYISGMASPAGPSSAERKRETKSEAEGPAPLSAPPTSAGQQRG